MLIGDLDEVKGLIEKVISSYVYCMIKKMMK